MDREVEMALTEELQAAVGTVTGRIGPATVTIGRDRRGTGVVIADGQVLTNAHNLRDRTTQVTFADGRTSQAEVLGADPDGDLAVLAVDTAGADPVEWSSREAAAGQVVFAAARGRHGGALRVTFGTVSALDRPFRGPRGRRITGGVEHTAPLARGSSGGPLADAEGRLVGVNTHRLDDGFYLAIAAGSELRQRIEELAAGRPPRHLRLGVAVAPSHVARRLRRAVGLPERDGLLVRGVEADSPAATAGLAAGDLIVTADGAEIRSTDDLWAVLDALGSAHRDEAGATVELGIVRGAEELTLSVAFGASDTAHEQPE